MYYKAKRVMINIVLRTLFRLKIQAPLNCFEHPQTKKLGYATAPTKTRIVLIPAFWYSGRTLNKIVIYSFIGGDMTYVDVVAVCFGLKYICIKSYNMGLMVAYFSTMVHVKFIRENRNKRLYAGETVCFKTIYIRYNL